MAKSDPTRATFLSAYFDGKFSIEEVGKLSDKQAEAVDRVIDKAIKLIKDASRVTGETSDGYHTFKELYRYRMLYNALAFRALVSEPGTMPHKSRFHSDGEPCFGGGWFIVVAYLDGKQISNHYEEKDWDMFDIEERIRADEWDGHTPKDVAERIESYLRRGNANH